MFRCGRCGRTTKPREKGTLIVVAKRDREYQPVDDKGHPSLDRNGAPRTTRGWEITKEIRVCGTCA